MKDKRTIVLMGVLLVLLALYLLRGPAETYLFSAASPRPVSLLAGENKLTALRVVANKDGSYTAHVEYFYRGDLGEQARIGVRAVSGADANPYAGVSKLVAPGAGAVDIVLGRPADKIEAQVTRRVVAHLGDPMKPLATTSVDQSIEWPDAWQYQSRVALSKKSVEQLYKEAVELIDSDSSTSLEQARLQLEQILLQKPSDVAARIELARYAMKTRWGPEGLAQAETYLLSALSQDKDNANAKILLGYVYAHQRRFKEAEAELSSVAAIGSDNLWLWANWGELLSFQKKDDLAIEKYLHAVAGERPFNTYDRARLDAYWHLFKLLERKKQFDRAESLHAKRVAEFGNMPCLRVEHARFRIARFSDHEGAISEAQAALSNGCPSEEARAVLGAAYYLAWAGLAGEEKLKAKTQAQVFLPEGPAMLYELAKQDSTIKVIAKLAKGGMSLRLQDNDKMNALAYALLREDVDSARRLLRLGAKGTDMVGADPYPVALIPLLNQSVPGVVLMQQSGVNYTKIRFNGITAQDLARQMGNRELLKALEQGASFIM